jgi:hypothetical protein
VESGEATTETVTTLEQGVNILTGNLYAQPRLDPTTVADNTSVEDLVDDLEQALVATGLGDAVTVALDNDRLRLARRTSGRKSGWKWTRSRCPRRLPRRPSAKVSRSSVARTPSGAPARSAFTWAILAAPIVPMSSSRFRRLAGAPRRASRTRRKVPSACKSCCWTAPGKSSLESISAIRPSTLRPVSRQAAIRWCWRIPDRRRSRRGPRGSSQDLPTKRDNRSPLRSSAIPIRTCSPHSPSWTKRRGT